MITSETRPGSIPARSSAALIATAPRSWAGVVAKAPLKLPTGVRAALTMTTSSDMDLSWRLEDFSGAGWRGRLVTHPVNLVIHCQSARGEAAAPHSKSHPLG